MGDECITSCAEGGTDFYGSGENKLAGAVMGNSGGISVHAL